MMQRSSRVWSRAFIAFVAGGVAGGVGGVGGVANAQVAGTEVGVFHTGPGQTAQSFLGSNTTGVSLINEWAPLGGFEFPAAEVTYRVEHAGGAFAIYLDIFYNAYNPGGFLGDHENWAGDASDIDMFLIGPSGLATDLIAASYLFAQPGGTNPNELIELADLAAGTYYIVIDGYITWDGTDIVQAADFEVYTVPAPAGAVLGAGALAIGAARRRR